MLVTSWCGWLKFDDRISILVKSFECWCPTLMHTESGWIIHDDGESPLVSKMTKTVTNFLLLSPTHLVSRIRHQHWCNLSLLSLYGFRVAKTPLFYLNHSTFESYFGCQFFYITVIFCFMSIHGKEKKTKLIRWDWRVTVLLVSMVNRASMLPVGIRRTVTGLILSARCRLHHEVLFHIPFIQFHMMWTLLECGATESRV